MIRAIYPRYIGANEVGMNQFEIADTREPDRSDLHGRPNLQNRTSTYDRCRRFVQSTSGTAQYPIVGGLVTRPAQLQSL